VQALSVGGVLRRWRAPYTGGPLLAGRPRVGGLIGAGYFFLPWFLRGILATCVFAGPGGG